MRLVNLLFVKKYILYTILFISILSFAFQPKEAIDIVEDSQIVELTSYSPFKNTFLNSIESSNGVSSVYKVNPREEVKTLSKTVWFNSVDVINTSIKNYHYIADLIPCYNLIELHRLNI